MCCIYIMYQSNTTTPFYVNLFLFKAKRLGSHNAFLKECSVRIFISEGPDDDYVIVETCCLKQ